MREQLFIEYERTRQAISCLGALLKADEEIVALKREQRAFTAFA